MYTYSQLSARAYDTMGSPNDSGISTANINQDINQAQQMFKNTVRNYWTRNQITTTLAVGQQDYTMPANFVRTTEVTITANGIVYPLEPVPSEHEWNKLNIIPSVTIYIPTRYFIKGFNVISVWPAPSTNNIGTLSVSFQPRLRDWSANLADITGTCIVNQGQTLVTNSATNWSANLIGDGFSVTDGTGGNWYPIQDVPTDNSLNLQNSYIDQTSSNATYIIGQIPDIPEEYQSALWYFPLYHFELKRGNIKEAESYYGMFENLLNLYEETYAIKTTGIVQTKQRGQTFSVFGIPPTNLS